MGIEFTDVFCGAGGSSAGLEAAGLTLKLAANHWDRAIETHAANFPDADHLIADVSNYDMRRLPRTPVGWFSPECTWHSPAGGHIQASVARAQLDVFDDYVPSAAAIRSRATAFDVIRAAEVHRYKVLIVENVVEFARWEMFDWWLDGLRSLDYTCQFISVSSAHVGDETNTPAPQWRDRLYVFCTAKGVPVPDVTPRPIAWCEACGVDVEAVQSWRNPKKRKIGKYRQQYDYRCPRAGCRHSIVEPYVLPAATIIDWTDIGTRIGDRARPLAPATMRRIRTGLEQFAQPTMLTVTHGAEDPSGGRAYPAAAGPVPARTTKTGDGLACPPMLVPAGGGWNTTATTALEPARTRTTRDIEGICTPSSGAPFIATLRRNGSAEGLGQPISTLATARHHGLTTPPGAFIQKYHGGLDYPGVRHMVETVTDPLSALVARPNMSLVIPYRKTAVATTDSPLLTQATVESAALATPALAIEDCHFRMLKPRESARAQRFADTYQILGNQGEQQMQAGNAVSSNVPQWLGGKVIEALA